MSREVKILPGLTAKSLILGIALSIITVVWMVVGEYYVNRTPVLETVSLSKDYPGNFLSGAVRNANNKIFFAILGIFLIPLLISALLPEKHKLTMQELTFIYAMTSPITSIAGLAKAPFGVTLRFFMTSQVDEQAAKILALIMPGNSLEEAKNILSMAEYGGHAVPWAAWIPVIGMYILLFTSFYFFLNFGGALLRIIWVDRESLAFPYAKVVSELIQGCSRESRSSIFKQKLLWIGAAISFVLGLVNGGWGLFNLPDIVDLELDLYPYGFTPIGIPYFSFEPTSIGLGLLLPRDVLASVVLAYIVFFWILPYIYALMGIMDPTRRAPAVGVQMNYYRKIYGSVFGPISDTGWIGSGIWLIYGMALAVGLYPLFRNREALAYTIRAAFRGEEEGRTYRILWIGWILSGAAYIAGLVVLGMPIYYAILTITLIAILRMCVSRVIAEAGADFGWVDVFNGAVTRNIPYAIRDRAFLYPYHVTVGLINDNPGRGFGRMDTLTWAMSSYKVAQNTRTKWTDLILGHLITTALGIFIAIPLYLTLVYTVRGYANTRIPSYSIRWIERNYLSGRSLWFNATGNFNVEYIYAGAIGFLVAILLMIARAWIGGPFHYISVAGIVSFLSFPHCWFPYLVAFIVQRIALRIGGAEFYNKKIIPFAVGLIFGLAILWFVLAVGWTIKGVLT